MCLVPKPPSLFVSTPFQAPEAWLLVLGLLVLGIGICGTGLLKHRATGKKWLWIGGMIAFACILGGAFLDLIVALPWEAAVQEWHSRQLGLMVARGCSLTDLNVLFAQAGDLGRRLAVTGKLLEVGGAVFGLGWAGGYFVAQRVNHRSTP